jgi:MFS family permease
MDLEKSKLLTKEYIIITFMNFLITLNFFLLMIVVADYAMKKYNSPPSEAGFSASIFIIGALVARLFAGKWIARVGYKKMLYVGAIASFVMSLLYFTINSVNLLFVVRIFHGAAFGVITTAAATIISDIVPRERSGEGIGYYSLGGTIATAIGPFMGMFLSRHGSYSIIFAVCSIISGLGLVVIQFLSLRKIEFSDEQKKDMHSLKLSNFIEPGVIPVSTVYLLACLGYSSILSFLTIYAKEIHLVDAAGFFFIVYAAAVLISRPVVGRLFDLKGENSVMYPAILILTAGMFLFSQSYYGYMLLSAATLIGLGFGAIQSSIQTIVIKITQQHRLGLANSSFFLFADIGMGIGPLLAGFIIPFIGYRKMYMVVAIIAFTCLMFYYLLHARKNKIKI